jgi:glutamate-1-semialdehyde aminotransferase
MTRDDPEDTIVPRYRAAGGNPEKLHIIRAVQEGANKRAFSLQADMGPLEAKIREVGDVACVIIDPVSSYMGTVDSHKNSAVRGVIDPLTELASSTGAAFLLNTHFPKTAPATR